MFSPQISSSDKRTSAWLKLKKDYVTGLGDTLDVVPIGAWYGNGRKAQWWSPVLLALRDMRTDGLVAMCKCMSGEPAVLGPPNKKLTAVPGFSDSFYRVRISFSGLAP